MPSTKEQFLNKRAIYSKCCVPSLLTILNDPLSVCHKCISLCSAYPLSSRDESEVYCEHCTRWAACSHHMHMNTHRLLSRSPPVKKKKTLKWANHRKTWTWKNLENKGWVHGWGICCLWWPIQSALLRMWWPSPHSTKRLNPRRMYSAHFQRMRRHIVPERARKTEK